MANTQRLAFDTFASGSFAAGWGSVFGVGIPMGQVVIGTPNVVEGSVVNNNSGQMWTGISWPNDQTSEVVIQTLGNSSGNLNLVVRAQSNAVSGYLAVFQGLAGKLLIFEATNGSVVQLNVGITGLTFTPGDILGFQAVGSLLSVYQNTTTIDSVINGLYVSGTPGFYQNPATLNQNQVSTWTGYGPAGSGVSSGSWTQAFRNFVNKRGVRQ